MILGEAGGAEHGDARADEVQRPDAVDELGEDPDRAPQLAAAWLRTLEQALDVGGRGTLAPPRAGGAGLQMGRLEEPVRERLRAVLPPTASLGNPIDLVGDADAARFSNALHVLGGSTSADAALILLTAQAATDSPRVARSIIGATRDWTIPIAAAFVGGPRVAPGAETIEESGIPCYPFPERAVAALAGMALVGERRARPAGERSAPPAWRRSSRRRRRPCSTSCAWYRCCAASAASRRSTARRSARRSAASRGSRPRSPS